MSVTSMTSWASSLVLRCRDRIFPPYHYVGPSQDAREAAGRYARGNIAIQAGLFITEAELEQQRKEVGKISFPQ